LTNSLQILWEAANRGNSKEIERSVTSGVSANLWSAVADARHLSGSQGEGEIRVNWERTRRIPDSTLGGSLPSYREGVISEATELLRSISEIEGFEREGTVY
jgi:hypothetical protein